MWIDGIGVGHVEATIDYGSGRTTKSGSAASGAVHASYSSASGTETDDLDLDKFTMDGSTIEGKLPATGSGTTWSFAFDRNLGYASQMIELVAAIDFAAGDCCTALLSVGSRSEEMSLCEQP